MSSPRRLGRLSLIVVVGGTGVALLAAALVPGMTHLAAGSKYTGKVAPSISPLETPSKMYDAHGGVMATLQLKDREVAKLSEVPKVAINAVVATEDRTFWANTGVDFSSILRALVSNVNSGELAQGGSTITQQLVKNRYFKSPVKSLDRKAKEAFIAVRLTNEWSKRKILEEYLNTVYFGEGAYGIKAAARRFFNVPLGQLNVAQSALLAGSIRNPSGNDPFTHPAQALDRRAVVLGKMLHEHYITRAQQRLAEATPLPKVRPPYESGPNDFYTNEVVDELLANPRFGLGETESARRNALYGAGLRIETAYDPSLQLEATNASEQILPKGTPFTTAMVVMDPTTGGVKAIVSGPGYDKSKIDLYGPGTALNPGGRRPGSTIKAIDLAAAIEDGYSPDDRVDGSEGQVHPPNERPNAERQTCFNAESGAGVVTLREATRESINSAFFRLGYGVGFLRVADMAFRLGLSPVRRGTPWNPSDFYGSGGVSASPLEMATVYSTLASDGIRHDPMFISRILDADGHVIYKANTAGVRAISPQTARTVTQMLQAVFNGTGRSARIPGRPLAGKTGTVDNFTDAWFVGFSPQLTTAVWMGNPVSDNADDPAAQMRHVGGVEVFGGTYPARIWKAFMATALAPLPPLPFIAPDPGLWPTPRFVNEAGRAGPLVPIAPPPGPGTTTLPTVPQQVPPVQTRAVRPDTKPKQHPKPPTSAPTIPST